MMPAAPEGLGGCGCAISWVISAVSKITQESLVSRIQRDTLFLKVQFCYSDSTELMVKCVKLFCVTCASVTSFLIVPSSFFPVLLTWVYLFSLQRVLR